MAIGPLGAARSDRDSILSDVPLAGSRRDAPGQWLSRRSDVNSAIWLEEMRGAAFTSPSPRDSDGSPAVVGRLDHGVGLGAADIR